MTSVVMFPTVSQRLAQYVAHDKARTPRMPEAARTAWRNGFASQFGQRPLELLARALVMNDPRVIQGATTSPLPLPVCEDWPIESADPIAFLAWQGESLETVGEVESAWAEACQEADRLSPNAARALLNYWDETPRAVAHAALLREVNRSLREVG